MQIKRFTAALMLMVIAMSICSFPAYADRGVISEGATYTVDIDSPVNNTYPNLVYKEKGGMLTDGAKGKNDPYSEEYIHFYRGTYYIVTIDLGAQMGVDGIALGEYQKLGAGIHYSREVYLYVSDDGENFKEIGSVKNDNIIRDGGDGRKELEVKADDVYAARYVRVKFSSDIYAYVDEISVYGYKDTPSNAKAVTPDEPESDIGFAGAVDGINHICLIYTGEYYMGSVSNTGKVTQSQFTPYLCYVDQEGNVKDTMFEGMLFLPLAPISSSQDATVSYSFGKKAGWEAYLKATIGKDYAVLYNLAALDAEIDKQRETLGLAEDYQYPIYMAVPYVDNISVPFGEINGENIIPNTVEARSKVVDWYVDLIISEFNKAGFKNLKLNGFYWYSETILYKYGDSDVKLIKHFNEYAQGKGYTTTWIPYYCSPGFERAQELGFTASVLQCGYAFKRSETSETGDGLPGSCDDAVKQAEKYGLGTEIEVSGLDDSGYQRYYKYLQAAYAAGHMDDGLFMYYQNGGPGTYYHAAYATAGSSQRMGYDITYRFIKGTFTSNTPVIAENQIIIVEKGGKTSGNISVVDEDSAVSELKIAELIKPDQIQKLSIEGSGFIVINAKDVDFVGDTELKFSVTDGYNTSALATVKIKVVEDCFSISKENAAMRDNDTAIYTEGEKTGTESGVFEVVVENGVVTKVGGNNNSVPENGYVLAASGSKKEYLEQNAAKGKEVIYDSITGKVVFGDLVKTESGSGIGKYVPIIIAGCVAIGAVALAAVTVLKKKKN